MRRVTTVVLVGILLIASYDVQAHQKENSKHIIVPGVGVGDYRVGMSKNGVEMLNKSGKPEGMYFVMDDGVVKEISVYSPIYKFTNGLGVGDSEENIKQAFGHDFRFEEFNSKDLLTYKDKGLQFEINKQNRTVREITITKKISRVKSIGSVNEFDDVRSKDMSKLDFSSRKGLIATLQFNQETVWPEQAKMPPGCDPQKILTDAMNPGLGVRKLHRQSITGKGVNVAIIDQPLLPDHPEYNGKIVAYYDTGCGPSKSSMHGPAVASLLVGTNCGTAPDARVYYVAAPSWSADTAYYTKGLEWIIAQNKKLPVANKIRVVSVSARPSGPGSPFKKNQEKWDEACARAEADGIMVLDCTRHRGFISQCWYDIKDTERVDKCTPGEPKGGLHVNPAAIHVPASCRTTAQHFDFHGRNSYIYWGQGGTSWSVPYCAGVLAMGCQIRPDLSPAQMKKLLFASAYVHKSSARIINPTAFIELVRNKSGNQHIRARLQTNSGARRIVPGLRIGEYTLDMSKDNVLSKLGEPEAIRFGRDEVIRRGQKKYNLNDLPGEYILSFRDVSFWFENDSIQLINVHSPLYKLGNGLGVGDSEQKIKQAFGEDYDIEEAQGKEVCWYQAEGIGFEIHKKNRTIAGILVYRDVQDSAEAALVRKVAADGLVAYKLTTPDEFKAIVGKPIREWTTSGGDEIYLKYPGIRARFFGQSDIQTPHTLISIWCEGRGIDIGRDRPIVLRHEGDLDKFGSYGGFSNVDLSRLDLSQKGELLKKMPFDSLTVWPPSDRLPPNFDPAKLLEWGKNPGLGTRSLHREGITGKGVGIAIIDQPLLKDHVEYADRIKSYHAIEVEGVGIMGHGSPVCSIAVGKTCGVAPEASLHYYAHAPWKWSDNRPWARTVEQIVERNQYLSSSEKVRVISISNGLFSKRDYFDQWKSAVKKAHKNGILVVTCDPHFLRYVTLERLVGTDPDNPNNYSFESGMYALYVPAGNWSIASKLGKDVYTFDTRGANSWTVPYLAGLAALAFHVHPGISPGRIVTLFQETATHTKRGRVINPRGFVEAVKRIKAQEGL